MRDRGLFWNDEPLLERRHLVGAFVVASIGDEPAKLYVQPRLNDDFVFEMRLTEARETLAALELDATQSIAKFRVAAISKTWPTVGSMIIGAPIVCVIGAVAVPLPWKAAFVIGIPLTFLVLFFAALSSTRVRIGADALVVHWMLLYRRRIALRDVRALERTPLGLRLHLTAGKPFELRTGEEPSPRGRGLLADMLAERREQRALFDRELLYERIDQAHRAFALAAPMAFDAAVLDPAGRDVDEWIEAIRALGDRPAEDYRNVAVDTESMWEIVLDPRASAARRAAALLAFAPSLDAPREQHLRVMCRALLDDELRNTIEAVLARDPSATRKAMNVFARKASMNF